MMHNRRDFIKKAALLSGAVGLSNMLPSSIQQALAIDPEAGSTFMDAEHIVLLMQENRSFDHSFGTLRGVRGFNDPRCITLPNKNPVWLQSFKNGHTYAPFRLNIRESKAAWTSYLPHSWENQIAARNDGKHDSWLEAKRSGHKEYHDIPLTMGYYTREDIPFYYAFADAFTICDQHFCSSITGTTTNRHFFWTGKCVPEKGAKPLVRNSDVGFSANAHWQTFPEKLEQNNISWKVYQNELSLQNEVSDDRDPWLGNFTDNNLEWFAQYQVRFKKSHVDFYRKRISELPDEIAELRQLISSAKPSETQKLKNNLTNKEKQLQSFIKEAETYSEANFNKLSAFEKALHEKAFQTNETDPFYHQTEKIELEGETLTVPKGDVLHQFRQDVREGKLPTVSWLVAPQNFSDHPSAPMYGAWYVSEVLHILTENPDIWKKTIFILNYDENDGYFDHVPPFVAPDPQDPFSGKTAKSFDYSSEYVSLEQELQSANKASATAGPVGLGYRVPLIIASPWSRGGWVNSEVCDITSTIRFLEVFLHRKYGKDVREDNISSWRRGITGDLTSVFRPYRGEEFTLLTFLDRNRQILEINQSRNKPIPDGYVRFSGEQQQAIQRQPLFHPLLPAQEPGIKDANSLAYELYVNAIRVKDNISLRFTAAKDFFGEKSCNTPFLVYSDQHMIQNRNNWSIAVLAGEPLTFEWPIKAFDRNRYLLKTYGPNGFFRSFEGDLEDPGLEIDCLYAKDRKGMLTGDILIQLTNKGEKKLNVSFQSLAYQNLNKIFRLTAGKSISYKLDNSKSYGWYDFAITVEGTAFKRRFAGHVETGRPSKTDPLMGRMDLLHSKGT